MRVLATVLLMMSLLAMSVGMAGADIARPPCSSQARAGDLCHGPGLPGTQAEPVGKPGICLACVLPDDADAPAIRPTLRSPLTFGAPTRGESRRTMPWRPPRA